MIFRYQVQQMVEGNLAQIFRDKNKDAYNYLSDPSKLNKFIDWLHNVLNQTDLYLAKQGKTWSKIGISRSCWDYTKAYARLWLEKAEARAKKKQADHQNAHTRRLNMTKEEVKQVGDRTLR